MISLDRLERIVAVVPETCSGPGWKNQLIWVHIVSFDNKYRCESIQFDSMTSEMCSLFKVCEAAHDSMKNAVKVLLAGYHDSCGSSNKVNHVYEDC